VERKWRKSKYSVNSEKSLRENANKVNDNVKRIFATCKKIKQDDYMKISKFLHEC
jgi:hypothetical protein